MKKTKITNSLSVEKFDENDYLNNQKEIYDKLNKILNSFDFDENLSFAREYLDNLNGDIFLTNKKVEAPKTAIHQRFWGFKWCRRPESNRYSVARTGF